MLNKQRVRARVNGRVQASEIISLIDDTRVALNLHEKEGFDELIKKKYQTSLLVPERELEPMSRVEAERFESEKLPFMLSCGNQVKQTSRDVLHRWVEQRGFLVELSRYLASERVQQETGEE